MTDSPEPAHQVERLSVWGPALDLVAVLLVTALASVALGPSWWLVSQAYGSLVAPLLVPAAFVLAFFVFLSFFSLLVAITGRFVLPPVIPGTYTGRSRKLLSWNLQSSLHWMLVPFFLPYVHLLPSLRYTFYRIYGMQSEPPFHISPTARLPEPALVSLGVGSSIGDGAVLSCSFRLGREAVLIAPIRIGRNVLISPGAYVGPGVTIGENSIVDANSFVSPNTQIPANELWRGTPAVKVKDLPIEAR